MKRNAIAQLKLLKNDPRAGARDAAFWRAQETKLAMAIGARDEHTRSAYRLSDYFAYYRYSFAPQLLRSLAGVVTAVVLVAGGWMTTVQAAVKSLPGDTLYGFKLVTEQAQLRLASLERRAVLHTEFAERRLQEAVALQSAGTPVEDDVVRSTFTAYKKEITSANASLHELRQSGATAAIQTAATVEQKVGQLDTLIDQSVAANTQVVVEVQDARDASREVQSTAVAVAVETHEETGGDQGSAELEAMFKRELGDVTTRQAVSARRVSVVRSAVALYTNVLAASALPSVTDIAAIEQTITGIQGSTTGAANAFAQGDYRLAFEALRSADGELRFVETKLAQAEIAITIALTDAPVVASTETPEVEQQSPSQPDVTVTTPTAEEEPVQVTPSDTPQVE